MEVRGKDILATRSSGTWVAWTPHASGTLVARWWHTGGTLVAHWWHTGGTLVAHFRIRTNGMLTFWSNVV